MSACDMPSATRPIAMPSSSTCAADWDAPQSVWCRISRGPSSRTFFRFTYDPDRARRLLDEAGYRDPDGSGPHPRLTLSLKISTNEETRLQATAIQHDLGGVGIDLDVRSV